MTPAPDPSTLTRADLEAAYRRCAALLEKWEQKGYDLCKSPRNDWYDARVSQLDWCSSDLSAALSIPEPADEYAAHVAEHREDERLDRMQEADADESTPAD